MSEGTLSTQRINRMTLPAKTLLQGKRYTHSSQTDIRHTLAVHARLIRMQGARNAKA